MTPPDGPVPREHSANDVLDERSIFTETSTTVNVVLSSFLRPTLNVIIRLRSLHRPEVDFMQVTTS